jgi:hypothetical protein
MENELLKLKYNNLRVRLNSINSKLSNLVDNCGNLNNLLNSGILINDEIPENEKINTISKEISRIKNELSNTVIPIVNSKC